MTRPRRPCGGHGRGAGGRAQSHQIRDVRFQLPPRAAAGGGPAGATAGLGLAALHCTDCSALHCTALHFLIS